MFETINESLDGHELYSYDVSSIRVGHVVWESGAFRKVIATSNNCGRGVYSIATDDGKIREWVKSKGFVVLKKKVNKVVTPPNAS